MYCNSCLNQIPKEEVTYCSQCGVPLHQSCANHCLTCGKELCDTCYADNNFRCEECYKPENMFAVIRRSHIEQYAGCPYSLYLQLVLGIEPPMGKHAQLGVIVHEIIDSISHYHIELDEALTTLSERIQEFNLSTDDDYSIITMELEEVGVNCLKNFFLIKDSFSTNFKSEYNVKYSLDEELPMISCTLDRISFVGDDIIINDWKTGKPMSGQKLITDLQPPLYIYAVYKEFGKMPQSFNLHYLNANKHITYNYLGDMKYEVKTSRSTYILDVNEAIERTKKILKGIKSNKFNMPDEKAVKWRCDNMCWFGSSGKCKGGSNEQWKQLSKQYKEAS